MRLLFVCTGNICRSPMAEGLARAEVDREYPGKARLVEVCSAGVAALAGHPPAPEAVEAMRLRGIDISGHRAQDLDRPLASSSTLTLVMESGHENAVKSLSPPVRPVFTLRSLGEVAGGIKATGSPGGSPGGDEEALARRLDILVRAARAEAARDPRKFGPGSMEIADPLGMPLDEYVGTAEAMYACIREVLRVLLG